MRKNSPLFTFPCHNLSNSWKILTGPKGNIFNIHFWKVLFSDCFKVNSGNSIILKDFIVTTTNNFHTLGKSVIWEMPRDPDHPVKQWAQIRTQIPRTILILWNGECFWSKNSSFYFFTDLVSSTILAHQRSLINVYWVNRWKNSELLKLKTLATHTASVPIIKETKNWFPVAQKSYSLKQRFRKGSWYNLSAHGEPEDGIL